MSISLLKYISMDYHITIICLFQWIPEKNIYIYKHLICNNKQIKVNNLNKNYPTS